MNVSITEGLQLMPPPFADGLDVWSSGDGTAGSDTYANDANASYVPADQDFGGCLELYKSVATQKLRYMGQTPLVPGCYLKITARLKIVSGGFPGVRIAAWAGDANDNAVTGVTTVGTETALDSYGEIVEVSAIVGTGSRDGVDMPWGLSATYGHFGLDLTGATGGIIRIDDIEITDVTSAFLRDMINHVDVLDFGAVGDGSTDNTAAFEAADAAADGRAVLIPEGVYHLANHVTFDSPVTFHGTITMPNDMRLVLTRNFDLNSYYRAFGDEELAFKKAIQVLLNFSDHESLDLSGRQISLYGPIDVHATVGNRDTLNVRRVIRNGELVAQPSSSWDSTEVTSLATYSGNNSTQLTNVANIAAIPVGALVTQNSGGVGREVYVKDVNVAAQSLTLSQPLYDPNLGTQNFTFTRFKYILDFSGFSSLSKLILDDIDLKCQGNASGVMLPPDGQVFHFKDCSFTKPKDRGVTSIGKACQGMLVDRCQFLSNENAVSAQNRTSIALNVNANDVKIRDNRAVRFRHFAVMAGSGHMVANNHWFQGDDEPDGVRTGGVIFTNSNIRSIVVGNYIDNCGVEWTNEHDADPDFANELSFGGLSLTGNTFVAIDVADWFSWIIIKPHGAGHFINGMAVLGNVFRSLSGNVTRVDRADTSFATLDFGRMRNIEWSGNSYHGVDERTMNPVTLSHTEATAQSTWAIDFAPYLPFGARARRVVAAMPEGPVTQSNGVGVSEFPYADPNQGAGGTQVNLVWPGTRKGTVRITARMDEN